MDTPGLDVESVTGMVGGGAQVVVFTTGLGTPTGNPIAPVIKITGNAAPRVRWPTTSTSTSAASWTTPRRSTTRPSGCSPRCSTVASGKQTAAERLGHREFAIHRRNPTI